MSVKYPNSTTLEASILKALKALGGSAKSSEIDGFVMKDLDFTHEQKTQIRSGNRTEIQYRLAWVRTKAKKSGLIEKVGNNSWKLMGQ
jgi:restriction system protein